MLKQWCMSINSSVASNCKPEIWLYRMSKVVCALGISIVIAGNAAAVADEGVAPGGCSGHGKTACVDWKRLNLNNQQSQQIDHLQEEWNAKYQRLQPQILTLQTRLRTKFADPSADPLEIMATQQTLARLQEELRNEAMANYLRKRAILSMQQQRQLEGMVHQMVVERQQRMMPQTSQADEQNAGLMNIMHKVQWAIEPH